MTRTLCILAVLLASVALAQPFSNAPLLTRYNYIQPPSGKSRTATVEVTHGFGWAFTATSDGVYGFNTTLPSYSETYVQYFDALPGVTSLVATGPFTVLAIANNTLVVYEFNHTAAWRKAVFVSDILSFDVNRDTSSGTSMLYPVFSQGVMVIGTEQLVSTNVPSWSMVYAFNATTLQVLWNTTIGYDTTAYAPASYFGDQFVFVLAANRRGGSSSNFRVFKLYLVNGTILGEPLNTGNTYFTTISVTDAQLVVFSRYYIDFYDMAWTKLRNTVSISSYVDNMLFAPVAVNDTWYVVGDQYLYAFDYNTSAQLSWSPRSFSNNVYGGSLRFMNETMAGMFEADLLLQTGCKVFTVNASGVTQLLEFTTVSSGSSYCNPIGALFDYDWTHRHPFLNNIAHLSYQSSYGGSVFAINYTNGAVLAQATGDFNPIGRAKLDLWEGRVYSASTQGGIIQGFAFPPRRHASNFSDYAAQITISSGDSTLSQFGYAYNASNSSSYYITRENLYTVDNKGNAAFLTALGQELYSVTQTPLMIGKYFVFLGYYYYKYYVFAYDSQAKTIVNVQVCNVQEELPFINAGTIVYGSCSDQAAFSVDVSKTTLSMTSVGTSDSGRGVSADAKHVVVSTYSNVLVYDNTGKKLWDLKTKSSAYTPYSAPVLYGDNVFFAAYHYSLSQPGMLQATTTATVLVKAAVQSGALTTVGQLDPQSSSGWTIRIAQTGVFGSAGFVYGINGTAVVGFNMGTNAFVFRYLMNTTTYGSIVQNQASPVVLSTGAIAYFTSNSYLQVVGGFKGGLAWSYKGASSNRFPILTDEKSVYFVSSNTVMGADTYTGAVTSVSAFGTQSLLGYGLAPGVNETTVIGANGVVVFAATSPLYASPAGSNPSFPGGAPSGGNSLLEEAKSKAWIAGVVIGALVVIVIVVIIAKKKSAPSSSGDDYVAMNPATQV